ncbi:MAG: quinate 5-dehydrogenase [Anaerolineales bacterium]
MKHAISVSLGSSTRDKRVALTLLGERVLLERIGTDGDTAKAKALFEAFDGRVDALGVGGIDLHVGTDGRPYRLAAAWRLVQGVKQTPVVDGRGLKSTLEREAMHHIEAAIGERLQPKRALINVALDRYGMAEGIIEAGYEVVLGDLQFALGVPLPLRRLPTLNLIATVLAPVVGRLAPISAIYPTGVKQHESVPRFTRWYAWATVIAGDCSYTKRHMPPTLAGKTILTNTTTEADVARFREAGVSYLITTTPRVDGRSFGTNMLEAALVALADKGRRLTPEELQAMTRELALAPNIERLND